MRKPVFAIYYPSGTLGGGADEPPPAPSTPSPSTPSPSFPAPSIPVPVPEPVARAVTVPKPRDLEVEGSHVVAPGVRPPVSAPSMSSPMPALFRWLATDQPSPPGRTRRYVQLERDAPASPGAAVRPAPFAAQ